MHAFGGVRDQRESQRALSIEERRRMQGTAGEWDRQASHSIRHSLQSQIRSLERAPRTGGACKALYSMGTAAADLYA